MTSTAIGAAYQALVAQVTPKVAAISGAALVLGPLRGDEENLFVRLAGFDARTMEERATGLMEAEAFDLPGEIGAYTGDDDPTSLTNLVVAAADLLGAVIDGVRADYSLGGSCNGAGVHQTSPADPEPGPNGGTVIRCGFMVACTALVQT